MNSIILFRGANCWAAQFTGPHRKAIVDAFGSDTLPLPFVASAKAGDVARVIAGRHPGVRIGVKAAEFGPQTVAACLRETRGTIVWLREGRPL